MARFCEMRQRSDASTEHASTLTRTERTEPPDTPTETIPEILAADAQSADRPNEDLQTAHRPTATNSVEFCANEHVPSSKHDRNDDATTSPDPFKNLGNW